MVFHFESFQLDVAERRLLRSGELVPLRAKVFDTLCLLVENHGRLLRKDELMQRLWPDSVVEDNNLDHNISKLRSALQDGSNGQKFIETVPRQGYRFVANVRQISGSPAAQTVIPPPTADSPSEQEIQFFTTSDGVRLAYTIGGSGPPLVRAIDWLNHLDFEWKNPYRRHWFSQLMCHHTLLRYDQRGSGLSDWNVDDFSFERSLADFEELIASVGFDKFAIVGNARRSRARRKRFDRHWGTLHLCGRRKRRRAMVQTMALADEPLSGARLREPRIKTRSPKLFNCSGPSAVQMGHRQNGAC